MKQIQTNQTFAEKSYYRLINKLKARPGICNRHALRKCYFYTLPGYMFTVQRYENFIHTQKLINLKFEYNNETSLLSRFKAVFYSGRAIYHPAKDTAKLSRFRKPGGVSRLRALMTAENLCRFALHTLARVGGSLMDAAAPLFLSEYISALCPGWWFGYQNLQLCRG